MSKKKPSVVSQVLQAVRDPILERGFELWDVTYYKEGADWILEVAIDKEGGVSINDCSEITRVIEPLVDDLDPIETGYFLMVASAGSERTLRTTKHIQAAIDKNAKVVVKLYSPLDGKKEIIGVLTRTDDESIEVQEEGCESLTLSRKAVAKLSADFYN